MHKERPKHRNMKIKRIRKGVRRSNIQGKNGETGKRSTFEVTIA